jgi:O-antigen/teichoic acid export membrane protein
MTTEHVVCPQVPELALSPSEDRGRSWRGWIKPHLDRQVISDGAWLIGGQGLTAIAMLVGVRLLTEAVPPEVYGAVSLMVGLLTLGRNLFCFPFYQASLRFYSDAAHRGRIGELRAVLFRYLSRSTLLLAGLIVLLSIPYCTWRPTSPLLIPLLIGLLVVDVLRVMETDLLNAAGRQRPFAILRAGDAWARPVAAVLAVRWLGADPLVVLLGYLLSSGACLAGIFVFPVKRVGVSGGVGSLDGVDIPPDDGLRDRIWRFSLPLFPLAILEWISILSDRYVIGGLLGLEAAGIYIAAYGLVNQPFMMIDGVLELLLRPVYFEAVASGDHRRMRNTFRTWVAIIVMTCVTGVVIVTLLSDRIVAILLAERYRDAARFLPPIAAGNAMFAISVVFEKVAHAASRTGLVLIGRFVGAATSLVVGIPMILCFGVAGAAWAVPIYYGCQLLITYLVARRLDARTLAERG